MSTNEYPEAELLDLPEEDERPRIKIFTPKVIILSIIALYFLSQNIYQYITNPPPSASEIKHPQEDSWENFWNLYDRFQGYIIVSVVAFILFYYLRQQNDKVDEEKYLKMKQEEEEKEEEERKLQSAREERIIRKLEQEEREAEERQLRTAQSNTTMPVVEEHTKSE